MTVTHWKVIDAVMLASFVVSLVTSFVPTWNAAFHMLSPGRELVTLIWAITRMRRDQARDDYPYPTTGARFQGR